MSEQKKPSIYTIAVPIPRCRFLKKKTVVTPILIGPETKFLVIKKLVWT